MMFSYRSVDPDIHEFEKFLAALPQYEPERENFSIEKLNADKKRKKFLLGDFQPAGHKWFVRVKDIYLTEEKKKKKIKVYLLKEVYRKFKCMYRAAQKAGVSLKIVSGARNFTQQKSIWTEKWNGTRLVDLGDRKVNAKTEYALPKERARAIMMESAMPGASRHHWGTDIDIIDTSRSYFESEQGKKQYAWLKQNACHYGFCQPYTNKKDDNRSGYEEEKWHWSYVKFSAPLLDMYRDLVTTSDISGFEGSDLAAENKLNVINDYVLGISGWCKKAEGYPCAGKRPSVTCR